MDSAPDAGKCKRLILGWPRGGLGFVRELLQTHGYVVGCTFDHTTTHSNFAVKFQSAAAYEISVGAVPFLSRPELQQTAVTFVVRDPMRVLNSLNFHGTFHGEKETPALDLACRHLNNFKQQHWQRPRQAIVAFLLGWLGTAEQHRPNIEFLRVEESPAVILQQLTGQRPAKIRYCPFDINASNCQQTFTPARLPATAQNAMRDLLRRFGYLPSVWNPRGGHAHWVTPDWRG